VSDPHPPIRVPVGHPASGRPQDGDEPTRPRPPARPSITPTIDIHDGPDGLTLEADLPGATESNLSIQRLIHQEYPVGDYHRSFILSDDVDRERIAAELKDGVLKVFLPKADRARARRIEIKS